VEHPDESQAWFFGFLAIPSRDSREPARTADRYFGSIERDEFNISLDTIVKIAAGLDTRRALCAHGRGFRTGARPMRRTDRERQFCGPFAVRDNREHATGHPQRP
jgi:hypothetical protein